VEIISARVPRREEGDIHAKTGKLCQEERKRELCQDEIFVREEERTVPRRESLAKTRRREDYAKPRQLCQAEEIVPRRENYAKTVPYCFRRLI
jgi:hypothetical protein